VQCNVPVVLNVYHVGKSARIQQINELLKHVGTGIFHAGVSVHGREWSFSRKKEFKPRDKLCDPCNADTGISCGPPQKHPGHVYQESVVLGEVNLTATEVHNIIKQLASEWQGRDYNLVNKNCCHFCGAFCQALGVDSVPTWLTSLADAGVKLQHGIRSAGYPSEDKEFEIAVQNMLNKTKERMDAINVWGQQAGVFAGQLWSMVQTLGEVPDGNGNPERNNLDTHDAYG